MRVTSSAATESVAVTDEVDSPSFFAVESGCPTLQLSR